MSYNLRLRKVGIFGLILQLKRMPERAGHKAALRDPGVELDISGKGISEEGFGEVMQALVHVSSFSDEGEILLRLEEASFKGNSLTTSCLGLLAPVIKRSARDLRELDLAGNRIKVETSKDSQEWERFLLAINECHTLRRLDLSDNPIGPKAFEILSKVTAMRHSEIGGIRSIPYIIFLRTGINDASALHLSYFVASHPLPEELIGLVAQPKPGQQTQLLEWYDTIRGCRGIIYQPDSKLGNAGSKVLELAESFRTAKFKVDHHFVDEGTTINGLADLSVSEAVSSPITPNSRPQTMSVGTCSANSPTSRSGELDRARSRIQGDILRDVGISGNDLWNAAMRMLRYSRIILLQRSKVRKDWAAHTVERPVRHLLSSESRVLANSKQLATFSTTQCDLDAFPTLPSSPRSSLSSTKKQPLGNGNPNFTIIPRDPIRRKGSIKTARGPITFHNGPLDRVKADETSLRPSPTINRTDAEDADGTKLPCGLPESVWTWILTYAADAEGLLSARQRKAVVLWAMDRQSLNEEMGALGKSDSQQVWRVLNGMGCLAYDEEDPAA